jgi:hypothetical protein
MTETLTVILIIAGFLVIPPFAVYRTIRAGWTEREALGLMLITYVVLFILAGLIAHFYP